MIQITLETAKYFVSLSDQLSGRGKLSSALFDNSKFGEDHDAAYDLCEAAVNFARTAKAYSGIAEPVSSVSLTPDHIATFHMIRNYHSGE